MNAQLQPTGSAYFIASETEKPVTQDLSVLVDNEPGVLARVIGLWSFAHAHAQRTNSLWNRRHKYSVPTCLRVQNKRLRLLLLQLQRGSITCGRDDLQDC